MGESPKPLFRLAGRPLFTYPLELLRRLTSKIVVSASDGSPYADAGLSVIRDVHDGVGPLGGVSACLAQLADFRFALILACDMPFLAERDIEVLMSAMSKGVQAVHLRTRERLYPFPLLLRSSFVAEAESAIALGNLKMQDFSKRIGATVIPVPDGWEDDLFNINTLDDLKEAELRCRLR